MAKINDLSIAEKMKYLYQLQMIDSQISEIEIFKGELPIEVRDLEDEIEGLNTRLNRLAQAVQDNKKEISAHKANIKDSENMILKYEKQLETVKNNREYDALTKEIELQKLEIQLSNKKIGESEKNGLAKEELLKGAEENLAKKKKALDDKRVELSEIIEKTEKEEKELQNKSANAQKKIEDRLLKAYQKIRTTYRNGLAVVPVKRSACGGCYNIIPPQTQLELGMHKKIIVCEHCGRILIDESILETTTV